MNFASNLALLSIKMHEGYRRFPYRDTTGHLTIGYGRNLDGVGISSSEAEGLAELDTLQAYAELQEHCSEALDLDHRRTAVCVEMIFNLGLHGYMTFKKMRAAIRRGDFDEAAAQALDSKWAKQVGARAEHLAYQLRTGLPWATPSHTL